jgi:hypothetical protein
MMQSQEINEILTALSHAQAEIATAKKDTAAYNYNYADLAEVWSVCKDALTKWGLCVCQTTDITEQGVFCLITTLGHKSGQWMRSRMPLNPADQKPQTLGSMLTYYRRYALSAIVGVATEKDDDGAAAQEAQREKDVKAKKKDKVQDKAVEAEIEDDFWHMIAPTYPESKVMEFLKLCAEKKGKRPVDVMDEALGSPKEFEEALKKHLDKQRVAVA